MECGGPTGGHLARVPGTRSCLHHYTKEAVWTKTSNIPYEISLANARQHTELTRSYFQNTLVAVCTSVAGFFRSVNFFFWMILWLAVLGRKANCLVFLLCSFCCVFCPPLYPNNVRITGRKTRKHTGQTIEFNTTQKRKTAFTLSRTWENNVKF